MPNVAEIIESTKDMERIRKAKEKMPVFMSIDIGGVYNYILIGEDPKQERIKSNEIIKDYFFAIDDDYLKVDIEPIHQLSSVIPYSKLNENFNDLLIKGTPAMGIIKDVFIRHINQYMNFNLILLNFYDMIKSGKGNTQMPYNNAYVISLKRSKTGIKREIERKNNDESITKIDPNIGLGIVVGGNIHFGRFKEEEIKRNDSHLTLRDMYCAYITPKNKERYADGIVIPIVDVVSLVGRYEPVFKEKNPQLFRVYQQIKEETLF